MPDQSTNMSPTDRFLPPPKPTLLRRSSPWFLFIVGILLGSSWPFFRELPPPQEWFKPPTTPYEAYLLKLQKSSLDSTEMGRLWIKAGEESFKKAAFIELPFEEDGYIGRSEARALSYQWTNQEGEMVDISIEVQSIHPAQVFLDLYQVFPEGTQIPRPVAAADSGSFNFSYTIRGKGNYLLRIQPELLQEIHYSLQIIKKPSLGFPVFGKNTNAIRSFFGADRDGGRRKHKGVDIFAAKGTPAIAAISGQVSRVKEGGLGGKVVWLRDGNYPQSLYYAHLDTQWVQQGEMVQPGDTLGLVGNTGNARTTPPHLHFGIYRRRQGAVDPYPFLFESDTITVKNQIPAQDFGKWMRTISDQIPLYQTPSKERHEIQSYSKSTLVKIVGGVGKWCKVQTAIGQVGYIAVNSLEVIDEPLLEKQWNEEKIIYSGPTLLSIPVMKILPGETVNVVGMNGNYYWIATSNGTSGWIEDQHF